MLFRLEKYVLVFEFLGGGFGSNGYFMFMFYVYIYEREKVRDEERKKYMNK